MTKELYEKILWRLLPNPAKDPDMYNFLVEVKEKFFRTPNEQEVIKEWEELGYTVEIDIKREVMQITGEENSITVDLTAKEFWIEKWISYKIFTLLYKTMEALKNE